MSPVVEGDSFDVSPTSPTFPRGLSSSSGSSNIGTPISKRHSGIPSLRTQYQIGDQVFQNTPSPPPPNWSVGVKRTKTLDTPSRGHTPGQRSPLGMAPGRSNGLNASTSSMTRSGTLTNIAGISNQGGPNSPAQLRTSANRLGGGGAGVIPSSRTVTNMTPYTDGGPRARVYSSASTVTPRGRITDSAQALARRAGAASSTTSSSLVSGSGTVKAKTGMMKSIKRQVSHAHLRVSSAVHGGQRTKIAVAQESPGMGDGDLTTVSSDSPGGWTHIARSNSPDKMVAGERAGSGPRGSRLRFGGDEKDSEQSSSAINVSQSTSSTQRTLPARLGIPSPYLTRSQMASSARTAQQHNNAHQSQDQWASSSTTASSSSATSISADLNRPMTPSSESSRLPIMVHRPSSRASNYDPDQGDLPPPRSSSRLAQSTSRFPPSSSRLAFPSESSSKIQPPRPSSRTESRPSSRAEYRPSSRTEYRKPSGPASNGDQLTSSSSYTQDDNLGASQSGLPRSTRRISMGLAKSQNGGTPATPTSGIPVSRRSVSGRPLSMGNFATTPPPPVPVVASQYRKPAPPGGAGGRGDQGNLSRQEQIGLGLPVPPRRR